MVRDLYITSPSAIWISLTVNLIVLKRDGEKKRKKRGVKRLV
jgi:hypothetical protein